MQDACFSITMKSGTGLEDKLKALILCLEPTLQVCRGNAIIAPRTAECVVFIRATGETVIPLTRTRDHLVAFLKDSATAFDVFDGDETYRLASGRQAIRISGVIQAGSVHENRALQK